MRPRLPFANFVAPYLLGGMFVWILCITQAFALDRELAIELDPIKDAKAYEIRITPVKGTPGTPFTQRLSKPEFSKRLPLGTYHIETRSFDIRGVAGRWNDLGTTEIAFKPPTLLEPVPNKQLQISAGKHLKIDFKWKTFHDQANYELTVADANSPDKIVKRTNVIGGMTSLPLNPGSYTWSVRSLLPTGASLDGKDPEPQLFSIKGPPLTDPKIDKPDKVPPEIISWRNVPDATHYEVSLVRTKDAQDQPITPPISIVNERQNDFKITIPHLDPGTYQLSVTAVAENHEPSRQRYITWRIKPPQTIVKEKEKEKTESSKPAKPKPPNYSNLVTASLGPVLWSYNFTSTESGDTFNLVAATVTTTTADLIHWFGHNQKKSRWGLELRGRHTNVYLFEDGDPNNELQEPLTVADRRIAVITHYRRAKDRLAFEALLGYGAHHLTYLLQDDTLKTIRTQSGNLTEFYLGGSLDWTSTAGHHGIFDLTFHPVSAAQAMSVSQTRQYTLSLRFLQNMIQDRAYLAYIFENYRSSIQMTSDFFPGQATTTSTWYRFGLGLGFAF